MKPNESPITAIVSRVPLWVLVGIVLLAVALASVSNAYREYNNTMEQAQTLLSHADEMLYRAKHEGRNRVIAFGM